MGYCVLNEELHEGPMLYMWRALLKKRLLYTTMLQCSRLRCEHRLEVVWQTCWVLTHQLEFGTYQHHFQQPWDPGRGALQYGWLAQSLYISIQANKKQTTLHVNGTQPRWPPIFNKLVMNKRSGKVQAVTSVRARSWYTEAGLIHCRSTGTLLDSYDLAGLRAVTARSIIILGVWCC
jgi:hypothetical protein